jgi:hypothetical protein
MVPDIDLQLTVVIRALKGVVWESLSPDNITARENLRASIATLEFVLGRQSSQFARAAAELSNTLDLAQRLAAIAADTELDGALGAAKSVLDGKRPSDLRTYDVHRARLTRIICDFVESARDPTVKRNIAAAIILASKSQCDLTRAWCLPAGFEADPKRVATLEDFLGHGPLEESGAV